MSATRVQGLQVEYLEGEALVFNPRDARATALNDVATAVFDMCDGDHGVDEMIAGLDAAGLGPSSADVVWLALRELAQSGLVELEGEAPESSSRRALLKRMVGAAAGAAILLPIVETINAPVAAAQGSGPVPSPSPTPAPFAAPTPAPFAAPTPAPFAAPTPAPFAAPTPAPFAAPTPAPFAAPTPAPFAAPT